MEKDILSYTESKFHCSDEKRKIEEITKIMVRDVLFIDKSHFIIHIKDYKVSN